MAKPTIYWLSQMAKHTANSLPFIGTVVGFVGWLYNFIEIGIIGTFTWISEQLGTIDTGGFSGVSLTSMQWVGYINAVIPLSEMLSVLSAYYTAWLIVILIRWVKSFVPTVAN